MEAIKELDEFMENEEGKTIVSGWLKEAGYRSADDIAGLEHKKDELLGKVAKSQKDKAALNELYTKHGIVDADDLDLKLAMLEGAEAKGTEMEKLQRRLEIIEKAAETDKKLAETERALRVSSEKKAQILSELKKAHVNDESFDYLMPYFNGLVKAEDEDGKINLFVDTGDGPSPLNTFIETWSKTDNAKQFIKAPGNSGAGSTGAGGSGTAAETDLAKIEKLPPAERMKAYKELGIIKE